MGSTLLNPQRGQIYASNHSSDRKWHVRQECRVVNVTDEWVELRNEENGRISRVARHRFRNNSSGYRLVRW